MSHLTTVPFTPLRERIAVEVPELLGGLDISIEQTSDDFYSQEGILIV